MLKPPMALFFSINIGNVYLLKNFIGCPPAVINAVIDAIGTNVSMPATAEKVWKELKKNGAKKAAA